jgi:hypothetical protein
MQIASSSHLMFIPKKETSKNTKFIVQGWRSQYRHTFANVPSVDFLNSLIANAAGHQCLNVQGIGRFALSVW